MEQAAKKGDLLQSESRVQALEVERVEVLNVGSDQSHVG